MQSKQGNRLAESERARAVSTPLIVGASLVACAMLCAVTRRPRAGGWRRPTRAGIVPTMLRGALAGAIKAVPRLALVWLLEKVLRRERAERATRRPMSSAPANPNPLHRKRRQATKNDCDTTGIG